MKILIGGGTGFIGQALCHAFTEKGHELTVISRQGPHGQKKMSPEIRMVPWQSLNAQFIQPFDVVINLAGQNIGASRWNARVKQALLSSRVKTTAQLAKILAELGSDAPHWFNASAIGYYGFQNPQAQLPLPFDESTSVAGLNSDSFSAKLVKTWEEATLPAQHAGVSVTLLRFGVVLAWHDGALKKMAAPYHWGLGGQVGCGLQPISWVSLADVVGAIEFLLTHPGCPQGPINIVAPGCVMQKEFSSILAHHLERPNFLPMPEIAVKILFGQMGQELLLSGAHIKSQVLSKLGYDFKAPTLQNAFSIEH